MTDCPAPDWQKYVDRMCQEQARLLDFRFEGSDRVWQHRIEALDARIAVELAAIRAATDKADRDIRERVHDGNRIREEMRENAATFITRTEVEVLLSSAFAKTIGLVSAVVAIGGLIIGVIALFGQRVSVIGGP